MAMGAAGGSLAANVANKFLTDITSGMDPKSGPIVRGLGMIVAGAMIPDFVGKGPAAEAAGSVVIGKGAEQILKVVAPNFVSGFEDIAGPDEEEALEGPDDEELIEGPETNDSQVAGTVSGSAY